ncbi:MAG: SRPBCC family protein [Weeksellaceae bacterium]|nr:SRPBCC family protein [Weeksellaceae bacterium]
MKFKTDILINAPREKVVELFDNPDNMHKWMKGLESFEPISGTPGQPGAKSRITYDMGKRKVEMIETVTVRNLPQEFSGTYEANGVFNIVRNLFEEVSPHQTLYTTENEFQFKGFMKIIAALMPSAFKKQSVTFLQDFKAFVEEEINQSHGQ